MHGEVTVSIKIVGVASGKGEPVQNREQNLTLFYDGINTKEAIVDFLLKLSKMTLTGDDVDPVWIANIAERLACEAVVAEDYYVDDAEEYAKPFWEAAKAFRNELRRQEEEHRERNQRLKKEKTP